MENLNSFGSPNSVYSKYIRSATDAYSHNVQRHLLYFNTPTAIQRVIFISAEKFDAGTFI
jgi:hypothetical protein